MNTEKALFNIQRIQILNIKLTPSTSSLISNAYAHAWNVKLYPLLDSSGLHEAYESCFEITKAEVDFITEFADSEWLNKKYYSFYDYEDRFIRDSNRKIDTERWHLIAIFRYMFLQNTFDEKFWEILVENGKCPVEAKSIIREFDNKELNLI